MNETEKKVEEMLWHKDPRLMHRNKEYSRENVLKKLKLETNNYSLIDAYDDIIKFNNNASEYNIMIEAYRELSIKHFGGVDSIFANEEGWENLMKKYN